MIYCYTHKSVPPSTHIRKASCNLWGLTQSTKLDNVQKVTLNPSVLNGMTSSNPSPQGSGIYAEETVKIVRARGDR